MMVEHTLSHIIASALGDRIPSFVGYCDPDTLGGQIFTNPNRQPFEFEEIDCVEPVYKIRQFDLWRVDRDELLPCP